MKKFFSYLGIFCLLLVSFFYTEQTVTVVKEYDQVMIAIKEYSINNKKEPVNAYINENTIIPGLSGYEVDVDKSYYNMRRYGKFDSSLLEYQSILPDINLTKNKDKYIVSGNPDKRMVSLIFLLEENTDITPVLKILNEQKVKGNFFIDDKWLRNNSERLEQIIHDDHVIGNISSNFNYLDSSFLWMDTVIKKVGKQKSGYCYFKEEKEEEFNMCLLYDNYSIKPTLIENYPYKEVKEKVSSGSILSFSVNSNTINELSLIISYIKSKGLLIVNLNELLKE